jgi:hypothetical protein
LVQAKNEEEGVEYEFFHDMGENIMIRRFLKRRKSKVATLKILCFGQIFFEPDALMGEMYVKLLFIVEVVRIWFPKR